MDTLGAFLNLTTMLRLYVKMNFQTEEQELQCFAAE